MKEDYPLHRLRAQSMLAMPRSEGCEDAFAAAVRSVFGSYVPAHKIEELRAALEEKIGPG